MIASIYGMNFDIMPELHWKLGYGWALLMMLASAIAPISGSVRSNGYKLLRDDYHPPHKRGIISQIWTGTLAKNKKEDSPCAFRDFPSPPCSPY